MASFQDPEVEYERLRVLGSGSYGSAVLVQRVESGQARQFVIKEVDASRMSAEELRKAAQEADVLRKLSHPNIISYISSFLEAGKLCIVTEYADGGDLGDAIKRRSDNGAGFDDDEIMNMFVQLCLALHHVHFHQIIHRDLKAKNVFLTGAASGPDMTVKLGDFGIARMMSSSGSLAETQIGTPYYLSPEIYEDKPYGKKSDIWSLGVLLYEVIALELPFKASNIAALARKVLGEAPSRLPFPRRGAGKVPTKTATSFFSSVRKTALDSDHAQTLYPGGLQNLVDFLLRKIPEDRPSADDILRQHPVVRGAISALLGCSVPPPFVRENLDYLQHVLGQDGAAGDATPDASKAAMFLRDNQSGSTRRSRRMNSSEGSRILDGGGGDDDDDNADSSDHNITPRRAAASRRKGPSSSSSSGRVRGTPRQKGKTESVSEDRYDDLFLDVPSEELPLSTCNAPAKNQAPTTQSALPASTISRTPETGISPRVNESSAERREKIRRARVQQRMKQRQAPLSPSSMKQSPGRHGAERAPLISSTGSDESSGITSITMAAAAATTKPRAGPSHSPSRKDSQPPPTKIDTGQFKSSTRPGEQNHSPTTKRSPTASLWKWPQLFGSSGGGASGGGVGTGISAVNSSINGGDTGDDRDADVGDKNRMHETINPHFVPDEYKAVSRTEKDKDLSPRAVEPPVAPATTTTTYRELEY
jgi:serine/threonine protein kinase